MLASTRSRGGAKTYELARHLAPCRCRRAEQIASMPSLPMVERVAATRRTGRGQLSVGHHSEPRRRQNVRASVPLGALPMPPCREKCHHALITNGRTRCSYQTDRRGPAECWTTLEAAAAPKRTSWRATWRPGGTVVQRNLSPCPHCQWGERFAAGFTDLEVSI